MIPWEKNSINETANVHFGRKKVNLSLLKNYVRVLLSDVNLISAEFNDTKEVFERSVYYLIETKEKIKFFGLYLPSFEQDNPNEVPNLCIRHGAWDKDKIDKRNLCLDDLKYIDIQTQFFGGDIQSQAIKNINDIYLSLKQGVIFEELHDCVQKREISLEFSFELDGFEFKTSYVPTIEKAAKIESAIEQLHKVISHSDKVEYHPIKGTHRVSIKHSAQSLLEDYAVS